MDAGDERDVWVDRGTNLRLQFRIAVYAPLSWRTFPPRTGEPLPVPLWVPASAGMTYLRSANGGDWWSGAVVVGFLFVGVG